MELIDEKDQKIEFSKKPKTPKKKSKTSYRKLTQSEEDEPGCFSQKPNVTSNRYQKK